MFSNPQLVNTIVQDNRSFYFTRDPLCDPSVTPPCYGLFPAPTPIDDLAVLPRVAGRQLSPTYSLLTSLTGVGGESYAGNGNITGDAAFVQSYFNGHREGSIAFPEVTTAAQAPPAFDEGGNFIKLRFGPLTLYRIDPLTGLPANPAVPYGDYHIQSGSAALDAGTAIFQGTFPDLTSDFDGNARPQGSGPDIGADETPSLVVRALRQALSTGATR